MGCGESVCHTKGRVLRARRLHLARLVLGAGVSRGGGVRVWRGVGGPTTNFSR